MFVALNIKSSAKALFEKNIKKKYINTFNMIILFFIYFY